LKENLGSGDWRLTEDQLKTLDSVSDIGMPYPYDFIAKYTRE
jgi:hypothetical protein